MRALHAGIAAALMLASGSAAAQGMPISTDGTDPKAWAPGLDAVKAGARNHKVIYEDKEIRVLSVTVEPGEVEVAHHHQWPSVIVFVSIPPYENRDAQGNVLPRKVAPGEKQEQPVVVRVPPEAAHAVTNTGGTELRLIRIEYKNGFPKQP
jgi:hypothetical protein